MGIAMFGVLGFWGFGVLGQSRRVRWSSRLTSHPKPSSEDNVQKTAMELMQSLSSLAPDGAVVVTNGMEADDESEEETEQEFSFFSMESMRISPKYFSEDFESFAAQKSDGRWRPTAAGTKKAAASHGESLIQKTRNPSPRNPRRIRIRPSVSPGRPHIKKSTRLSRSRTRWNPQEHFTKLADHVDTLTRDRIKDIARGIRERMNLGGKKAELVQRILDHVKAKGDIHREISSGIADLDTSTKGGPGKRGRDPDKEKDRDGKTGAERKEAMKGKSTGHPAIDSLLTARQSASPKVRDAIDSALYNVGVEDPDKPPKKIDADPEKISRRLVSVLNDLDSHGISDADEAQILEALKLNGAEPIGEKGEPVDFVGSHHEGPAGSFTGDSHEVVNPGWVMKRADLFRRGLSRRRKRGRHPRRSRKRRRSPLSTRSQTRERHGQTSVFGQPHNKLQFEKWQDESKPFYDRLNALASTDVVTLDPILHSGLTKDGGITHNEVFRKLAQGWSEYRQSDKGSGASRTSGATARAGIQESLRVCSAPERVGWRRKGHRFPKVSNLLRRLERCR